MVAKGFESVGLPALVRPVSLEFDASAFCIVSLIGSVGNLARLGNFLWDKIKERFTLIESGRSLAFWCELVE